MPRGKLNIEAMPIRRPRSVERWRKHFETTRGICAERCPKHTGGVPGFCERKDRHAGMHGHVFREGMRDPDGSNVYDAFRPWMGCSWGDPVPTPPSPRRHAATDKGPLDGFL